MFFMYFAGFLAGLAIGFVQMIMNKKAALACTGQKEVSGFFYVLFALKVFIPLVFLTILALINKWLIVAGAAGILIYIFVFSVVNYIRKNKKD